MVHMIDIKDNKRRHLWRDLRNVKEPTSPTEFCVTGPKGIETCSCGPNLPKALSGCSAVICLATSLRRSAPNSFEVNNAKLVAEMNAQEDDNVTCYPRFLTQDTQRTSEYPAISLYWQSLGMESASIELLG